MRRVAGIGAVFVTMLGLAACGGSSSTSTGTTVAVKPARSPAVVAPTEKPKRGAQQQANAERKVAGRAAPFVRPESDNSVPTFGKEASPGERGAVEASLKRYLRARATEDWAAVCGGLAEATRKGFEKLGHSSGGGCAPILAALSKEADLTDPMTAGLLSLRVHGRNAFALFVGPAHQQYLVPLFREGSEWRPTQAGPIAYPPGSTG